MIKYNKIIMFLNRAKKYIKRHASTQYYLDYLDYLDTIEDDETREYMKVGIEDGWIEYK